MNFLRLDFGDRIDNRVRCPDSSNVNIGNLFFKVLFINICEFGIIFSNHLFGGNSIIYFQLHIAMIFEEFNYNILLTVGLNEIMSGDDMQSCFMIGSDLPYRVIYLECEFGCSWVLNGELLHPIHRSKSDLFRNNQASRLHYLVLMLYLLFTDFPNCSMINIYLFPVVQRKNGKL